jgi:hypothetical protein
MLRLLLNILILSLAVLVTSCFKDDELVARHIPGNYTTDTIELTSIYKNQVYYSLNDSNSLVVNNKDLWDLGFESSPSGWRVIPNSSCYMKAAYLAGQNFGSPADTTGAKWLFNPSDGSADSLAIGQWFTDIGSAVKKGSSHLVLIDKGLDVYGEPRGFSQLVIDSLVNDIYYFRIADMNGTNPKSYSVAKKNGYNYVLFSINDPTLVISEPENTSWDLLFSQYTTLLYTDVGDPYPYLVTGVLINSESVEVAVDSITPFANITFEMAQAMHFSKQADKIGYNWKKYNFDTGSYTTNSDINYIIRDTKGFLYKLRFIGFYKFLNNRLQKGYPSFEYQKL